MLDTDLFALLIYALWGVTLALIVFGWRLVLVMGSGFNPTGFKSGEEHGPDAYWRANRAHINTLENLPLFGFVVVIGHLSGAHGGLFDTLAVVVVSARIIQSLMHLLSGGSLAVNLRFLAWLTQLGSIITMAVLILQRSGTL